MHTGGGGVGGRGGGGRGGGGGGAPHVPPQKTLLNMTGNLFIIIITGFCVKIIITNT
jgi:hypothetical protein